MFKSSIPTIPYFCGAAYAEEGNGTPLQYSCLENPMEEPGGLQSMGSLRVGHDWSDAAAADFAILTRQTLNIAPI